MIASVTVYLGLKCLACISCSPLSSGLQNRALHYMFYDGKYANNKMITNASSIERGRVEMVYYSVFTENLVFEGVYIRCYHFQYQV